MKKKPEKNKDLEKDKREHKEPATNVTDTKEVLSDERGRYVKLYVGPDFFKDFRTKKPSDKQGA